jgi:hypothetical protein
MAPLVGYLIANGLPLVANALMTAGKQAVEEKLGVKIPEMTDGRLTPDQLFALKKIETEQPERLLTLALEERKMDMQDRAAERTEVTQRWAGDMRSDSWMSKNVRPLTLIYLVGVVTLFAFGSAFNLNVQQTYITLFGNLLEIVFVAYFGSRGLEKIASIVAPTIARR